ncbi:MAG: ABC transporter ATP-binding protein [Phototrophicales bacterium]|nr:MAG: ABC transporter ATP-binding protein [Phototrophicales bacterium]
MNSDIILETHHLTKQFGGLVAVNDVSLRFERGLLHAIIGPNGAGKTTFFNLLTGKYRPTSGVVVYKGEDITRQPVFQRARRGIGRSFQITNIFPNLTVLENVRLSAQALSPINFRFFRTALSYDRYVRRAYEVLETVGLSDYALLPANALPHGGKRKLELAILLAADPELLLLDEPTAGMASEQVPELIRTINALRQASQRAKTIIMVEHNMSVVMNISDRITVMNLGGVLAEGTPAEIAANKTVQSVYLGELYGDFSGGQGA